MTQVEPYNDDCAACRATLHDSLAPGDYLGGRRVKHGGTREHCSTCRGWISGLNPDPRYVPEDVPQWGPALRWRWWARIARWLRSWFR